MDKIKYNLKNEIYIPNMVKDELENKKICFLDIETTGLSSRYNEVILIGALCVEDGKTHITQLFANHIREEYELLKAFVILISRFEYIITFNGTSFDLPFLKKRLDYYDINHDLDKMPHLDLLKLVRKNKEILGLENCKLKTVERSLNIYREDTISGRESVSLYKDYVLTKDKYRKDIILKHNYDDIYYLPELLYIYDIIERENVLSIDVEYKKTMILFKFYKSEIEFKNNMLYLKGISKSTKLPSQMYYKDVYSLNWDTSRGDLDLNLQYKTGKLTSGEKCLYFDLTDSDICVLNSNRLNYNIPKNIVLLKINEDILFDNIMTLAEKIFCNIE